MRGKAHNITQLLAYLLEMDRSGGITKIEEISINLYTCGSKVEAMNLCSLFAKFPQENLENNILSISSFPSSAEGLQPRFFVFYRGIHNVIKYLLCFKLNQLFGQKCRTNVRKKSVPDVINSNVI